MRVEDANNGALPLRLVKNERPEQAADAQGQLAAKQQRQGGDKVELSSSYLSSASKGSQEFRADRVAEIKAQLEAGQYEVSGSAVAEKMIAKLGKGVTG